MTNPEPAPVVAPQTFPPASAAQPGYAMQPGYAAQPAPAGYPGYPPQGNPGQGYPQPGYPQPGYPQPGYAQPGYAQPSAGIPTPPRGLSLASMILGISGIVGAFLGFGVIPGIIAVILGHRASTRQPYARSTWQVGIITGYIGIGLGLIVGVLVLVFFATVMSPYLELFFWGLGNAFGT